MLSTEPDKQADQLFEIGAGLGETALSKLTKISGKDGEELAYKGAMLFFLCKAYKSYQAIRILWSTGFVEDAFVLVRTIFELALQARYMSGDPKPRARLFTEYDIVARYRYYERVRKLNDPILAATFARREHELQGLMEEYDRLKDRYPENKGWWGNNIAWLATQAGHAWKVRYKAVYWMSSNLVHSGAPTVKEYLIEQQGALKINCSPKRSDQVMVPTEATLYFLMLLGHVAEPLELGLNEQIQKGLGDFQKALGKGAKTDDNCGQPLISPSRIGGCP